MYLIIDEDSSACLVRYAEGLGHTAQRSIHIQGLGAGALDADIWQYAQMASAVIVTKNFIDFVPLARGVSHAGVIALPNVPAREQARLFSMLLAWIATAPFFGNIADHFVQIRSTGGIRSFQV